MEAAIKLIELNGVVRTAIRMIRGVELKLTDSTFEFAVFSIFPWFKVSTFAQAQLQMDSDSARLCPSGML